jgi:hypothetical protein
MSSYDKKKEAIKNKQSGLTYDDVKALMARRSDHMFELDNLPTQKHNFIDRGAKVTCENAGHAYHESWKPRQV